MRRFIAINPLAVSRPVAITLASILIVLALGAAGSKLLPHRLTLTVAQAPVVEQVMISKSSSRYLQPKLAILPPHGSMPNASSVVTVAPPPVQIARSATMSLYVKNIDKTVASVNEIARSKRGDVLSLDEQRAADQRAHPEAQMQLRVPDTRFVDTMNALAQAGVVRTQAITAEDLTAQIVDSSARLRNLRRTEGDILKIMDRSGSVGQVLEAENQLAQVREQIETTDADVKNMVNRVRYSTIAVTLEADVASVPASPAGIAQLTTAWAASTYALMQFTLGLLASVIWILTFAPYIAAIVLIGYVVRRRAQA